MNPSLRMFASDFLRLPGPAKAALAAALLFWPGFLVLTILDEHAGLTWLQTGNSRVWVPVVAAALLAAIVASLFFDGGVLRKLAAVSCSLAAFAAAYGAVVLIGIAFLDW